MSSQIKQAERKKNRAYWPVIGFILAVAIGVFAWFIAPDVTRFLRDHLPQLRNAGTAEMMRPFVAVGIFLVTGGIAVLIVAGMISASTPKDPTKIKEKELVKQRNAQVRAKEARRRRQQDINRQMKSGK